MLTSHERVGSHKVERTTRPESTTRAALSVLRVLVLVGFTAAASGCFSRPGFLVRVDPAVVPLADASRAELAARVTEIEQRLASGSARGGTARELREEMMRHQARLEKGDFQVGDQLIVTVTRENSQVDTATVREGMLISLTALPDASVAGLLRSELQPKMQSHIDRFLVDHRVRTNILTRIQILGAVGRPGFYGISPDRSVTELITLAGGTTPNANLNKVTVRRDGRLIVKPSMWNDAIRSGTTVAQLGLRSGDVLDIEVKKQRNIFMLVQIIAFGSTALFGIIRLLQFLYAEPE